jgi:hypothetical protein
MTRFIGICTLLAITNTAAFSPAPQTPHTTALFATARKTRSMNAMDSDRAIPKWAVGDDFDAPVLANPQYGTAVLSSAPIVDDECYMGKDGDFGACADFDPPKRENLWTNYQDKPRGERKGLSRFL